MRHDLAPNGRQRGPKSHPAAYDAQSALQQGSQRPQKAQPAIVVSYIKFCKFIKSYARAPHNFDVHLSDENHSCFLLTLRYSMQKSGLQRVNSSDVATAEAQRRNRSLRAFHISKDGEAPALVDLPTPTPGAGEVLLDIKACGLNFADLLMVTGTYQETPPAPFTLGMELAGVVNKPGEGVKHLKPGQRVMVFGGQGGLAEQGIFPVAQCVPLADDMPFEDAAAFLVAYGTSHVGLDYRAGLKEGETLVVTGAAGGVGLTAVEIGKKMGATVIAVARGADKLAVAKAAGADHLIDADTDDLRAEIKALGGADVVYDPVGGDAFKAAFRACKPEARILTIGFASGDVPQVPANHLLVKNLTLMGFYWGGYMKFKPQVIINSLQTLMGWYLEGKIKPHISHVLPLDQVADGLELLRSRKSTGKVVITP